MGYVVVMRTIKVIITCKSTCIQGLTAIKIWTMVRYVYNTDALVVMLMVENWVYNEFTMYLYVNFSDLTFAQPYLSQPTVSHSKFIAIPTLPTVMNAPWCTEQMAKKDQHQFNNACASFVLSVHKNHMVLTVPSPCFGSRMMG